LASAGCFSFAEATKALYKKIILHFLTNKKTAVLPFMLPKFKPMKNDYETEEQPVKNCPAE
jgi:hypothetical protein